MKSKLAITNFKNIFFALFLSTSLVAQDEQYVFFDKIDDMRSQEAQFYGSFSATYTHCL